MKKQKFKFGFQFKCERCGLRYFVVQKTISGVKEIIACPLCRSPVWEKQKNPIKVMLKITRGWKRK